MHVQLTDILTCPRCGAGHGLILMVEAMSDRYERHVRSGWLGCATCRERYRIEDGVADLRTDAPADDTSPAVGDATVAPAALPEVADAERLAALMGVAQGPAYLLLAGPAAAHAAAIAALLESVQVIVVGADVSAVREHARVTRVLVTRALPFQSGRVQGAVLSGGAAMLLEESARVLAAPARLVLIEVEPEAAVLERAGLRIAAAAEGLAVAVRR